MPVWADRILHDCISYEDIQSLTTPFPYPQCNLPDLSATERSSPIDLQSSWFWSGAKIATIINNNRGTLSAPVNANELSDLMI